MGTANILPLSNVINVTITTTPIGLAVTNVNNLALFTTELPNNSNPFGQYVSSTQVANDYGTNSITAAMANAVFAQTPNIRSGDGQLAIIPLLGSVSATAGQVVTANLSANLSAILLVSSGDISFTINTVVYNLTKLNFTKCLTWSDVAAVIQNSLQEGVVTSNTNGFTVTSKKVGTASTITMGAVSGGTGTALNGSGYFNSATSTPTAGVNSSGETILAAIARTQGLVPYVGLMTNLSIEDTAVAIIAAGVQSQDLMFLHHFSSTQDIAGIATTISSASEKKTRPLLYTLSQSAANLMKASYAGRGFSVNFTGSNTSQTMNLKTLATITPDTGITQTLYNATNVAGMDCYVSYSGVPAVFSTGGNDFFDNPYSDQALKFALETAGFNYLAQTNTKVPQTEQGMNGLKAAYAAVMDQFVRNGCLAPGQWNSSETFGDPLLFNQNITNNGYYIYSTPVALQNSADRTARKAPLVQIAAKRAGAIQESDVLVNINA